MTRPTPRPAPQSPQSPPQPPGDPGAQVAEEPRISQHTCDLYQKFTEEQVTGIQTAVTNRVAALHEEAEKIREEALREIAALHEEATQVQRDGERDIAQLRFVASGIAAKVELQPTLAPYLPEGKRVYPKELSPNPDAALERLNAAHDEQDAAEGAVR